MSCTPACNRLVASRSQMIAPFIFSSRRRVAENSAFDAGNRPMTREDTVRSDLSTMSAPARPMHDALRAPRSFVPAIWAIVLSNRSIAPSQ